MLELFMQNKIAVLDGVAVVAANLTAGATNFARPSAIPSSRLLGIVSADWQLAVKTGGRIKSEPLMIR